MICFVCFDCKDVESILAFKHIFGFYGFCCFLDRDQALKRVDLLHLAAFLGAEDFKKGEPLPDWLRNGFV